MLLKDIHPELVRSSVLRTTVKQGPALAELHENANVLLLSKELMLLLSKLLPQLNKLDLDLKEVIILVPLVMISDNKKFTLPVMIASLNSSTDIASNQGAIYMALAVAVVPIIIAFCFFSRYIISSISAGSVKE